MKSGELIRRFPFLEMAVEESPNSIVVTDCKGIIQYVNGKFCELTGYSFDEAVGQKPSILKGNKTPPAVYDDLWKTITAGKVWRGQFENKKKNGEFYWEQAVIYPVHSESGEITHFMAIKEDVTEKKLSEDRLAKVMQDMEWVNWEVRTANERLQAEVVERLKKETQLAQREAQYRLISENMRDLICLHSADGNYLYVSPSVHELLGYRPEELIGHNPYDYFHPDDKDRIRFESHDKAMVGVLNNRIEYRMRRADGHYVWLETLITPILSKDGHVDGLQTASRDISQRVELEQELTLYASTDPLTGVMNRRTGLALLEKQMLLSSRQNSPLSICFCDVNYLKETNDTLGHQLGDELIRALVKVLSESQRGSDSLCRLGGDEFLLILPNCTSTHAEAIWERVAARIKLENDGGKYPYKLSMAHGIVEYTLPQSVDELVATADEVMYAEKLAMHAVRNQ